MFYIVSYLYVSLDLVASSKSLSLARLQDTAPSTYLV